MAHKASNLAKAGVRMPSPFVNSSALASLSGKCTAHHVLPKKLLCNNYIMHKVCYGWAVNLFLSNEKLGRVGIIYSLKTV